MVFIGLFLFELFILYLLSGKVINILWNLLNRLTRSKKITVYLLSFLFLPGTLLHELAHWFTAKILFVHTGKMSLWPETNGYSIKFGSVLIAKSDPVRRFLIGVAPVFAGISIIMLIFYITNHLSLFKYNWWIIVLAYLIFDFGNTMFSSKKDMEGALELLLITSGITIILYLFGLQIPITNIESFITQPAIINSFQKGTYYMLFPLVIDAVIIIISKIILR